MSLSPSWHDIVKKLAQLGTYVTVSTTSGHTYYGVIEDYTNTGKFGLVKLINTGNNAHGGEDLITHLIAEREIIAITETSVMP